MRFFRAGCFALLLACASNAVCADTKIPGSVDGKRIRAADREPANWMTWGRTYDEQRFSPLKQINVGNVSRLGLAWYADLDTFRGVEATPLVVDGVLYNTSAWNITTPTMRRPAVSSGRMTPRSRAR